MTAMVVSLSDQDVLGLRALARCDGARDVERPALEQVASELLAQAIAQRLEAGVRPLAAPIDGAVAAPRSAPTRSLPVGGLVNSSEEPPEWADGSSTRSSVASRAAALFSRERFRRGAVAVLLTAALVVLVGGYGDHWGWTGFDQNNQVWDWMQLLLLPIAIGMFPLWLRYSEHMSRSRKVTLGVLGLAFVLFVVAGYLVPLSWTGFEGNTLWDWLTLIALPLTVATIVALSSSPGGIRRPHMAVFGGLAVALTITLVGGLAADWRWTGYEGSTLWEWLQLLLAPGALAAILMPSLVRWASGDPERRAREADVARQRDKAGGTAFN